MTIVEKVDKLHEALAWKGDIPIRSRYTAGVAGERFFREIKDNARFMGTRCDACDLVYVPAVMFCERCFSQLDEWLEVPSQGTVFTYTVLHRDLDDKPLVPPAILAHVKLYGTDGGLVCSLLPAGRGLTNPRPAALLGVKRWQPVSGACQTDIGWAADGQYTQ